MDGTVLQSVVVGLDFSPYIGPRFLRFDPPKVVEEPWSLEKEYQSALARLRVSIDANVAYNLKQMQQSYNVIMRKYTRGPLHDLIDRTRIRTQNDIAHNLINWHNVITSAGGGGGMPLSFNRNF